MKIRYVKRELEDEILGYLRLPQIIAIIGPRRSGKTTLLQKLQEQLSEVIYLSFEDQKVLDLFDQDIQTFGTLYLDKTKYLIIKENTYLRLFGDRSYHQNAQISGRTYRGL